jgi:hypothetical protein
MAIYAEVDQSVAATEFRATLGALGIAQQLHLARAVRSTERLGNWQREFAITSGTMEHLL